jgi:hypothetical protein
VKKIFWKNGKSLKKTKTMNLEFIKFKENLP